MNIIDVTLEINYSLDAPMDPAIDSNGNNCHDDCENLD